MPTQQRDGAVTAARLAATGALLGVALVQALPLDDRLLPLLLLAPVTSALLWVATWRSDRPVAVLGAAAVVVSLVTVFLAPVAWALGPLALVGAVVAVVGARSRDVLTTLVGAALGVSPAVTGGVVDLRHLGLLGGLTLVTAGLAVAVSAVAPRRQAQTGTA
ncbi:hypothetical protein GXP71_01535 [Cellulomonas sp. H30R-01]|uniref:hypothetical protein n=1 Tax=Cellulomonas TaxID=1707 RepID=UPI00138C2B2B|nr:MULTISPECIES: hypothetical protein [Cellulomonas]QHT54907.1 hypothetical protein GXP71_01535 [Cellulomonas sp. H30R-01]